MNIENISESIKKMKSAATFLMSAFTQCPKFPKEMYILTDADILIYIFSRYSLRMLYYAENYLQRIAKLQFDVRFPNIKEPTIKTSIGDEIYFDFDSFVFSCKSICEGKIIERSKYLHPDVKPLFDKKAEELHRTFIEPILNKVRHEVVHLNYFGSSFGSMAEITRKEDGYDIKIQTTFYTLDGKNIDLNEMFNILFINMEKLFIDISGLLLLHLFKTFGVPEKNVKFDASGIPIDYSYFNMPGVDIFN